MDRSRRLGIPLLMTVTALGTLVHCASPTALDVTIYSDIPCAKAADVAIVGGQTLAELPSKAPSATSNACNGGGALSTFGDIVLAPSGDKSGEVAFAAMMRVDGQPADTCTDPKNAALCIIARRQIRFSPHDELHMRIDLRASCAGVVCAGDQTCALGACVSAIVTADCHDGCDDSTFGVTPLAATPDAGPRSPPPSADAAPPVIPDNLSSLAAGSSHTCAIATDKTVRCWGTSNRGAIGDGTGIERHVPTPVMNLTGVVSLSAGLDFTCALTESKTVKCWGNNDEGQLGDGTTNDSPIPVDVANLSDVRSIATGCKHTCAVTNGGAVKCWGDNGKGELGLGNNNNTSKVSDVVGLGSGALYVTAGFEFTCVATTTGAKCFGDDTIMGQLGDGKMMSENAPVTATTIAFAPTLLSAGAQHVLAFHAAGTTSQLVTWGQNPGLAGMGSTSVDEVSAGDGYSCVRRGDAVQCWGSNNFGQLGNDSTAASATAVTPVALGSGVALLRAGYDHACVRTKDGRIACWGTNGNGQLGNNSTVESHRPVFLTAF